MKKLICNPVIWLAVAVLFSATGLITDFIHEGSAFSAILFGCGALTLAIGLFLLIPGSKEDSDKTVCITIPADISAKLSQVDWSYKNVLVGTVRTSEQLKYCFETNYYYAPAKFFQNSPFPFDYIALHEEGIGTEPAIRWFGEVATLQIICREDIPVAMRPETGPRENYYCFRVHKWTSLAKPITILDSWRGRPGFTNQFLLQHCTKSYQLFSISSERDFRLMQAVDKLYDELAESGTLPAPYRLDENHTICLKGKYLLLTDNSGKVRDKTLVTSFLTHPRAVFRNIKKLTSR